MDYFLALICQETAHYYCYTLLDLQTSTVDFLLHLHKIRSALFLGVCIQFISFCLVFYSGKSLSVWRTYKERYALKHFSGKFMMARTAIFLITLGQFYMQVH